MHELGSPETRRKRAPVSRRGKLTAGGDPVPAEIDLKNIFRDIERIRRTANNAGRFSSKGLIGEGRV